MSGKADQEAKKAVEELDEGYVLDPHWVPIRSYQDPHSHCSMPHAMMQGDPILKVPTLTPYYVHYMPYKTTRRRKDVSHKVPTLTPNYVHAIHGKPHHNDGLETAMAWGIQCRSEGQWGSPRRLRPT